MSAELLREAAAVMRARAEAATPGPWWAKGVWYHSGGFPLENARIPWPAVGHGRTGADVIAHTARQDGADAGHIASWHPAVALAVADWLDFEAEQIEDGVIFDVGGPADYLAVAYLGRTA